MSSTYRSSPAIGLASPADAYPHDHSTWEEVVRPRVLELFEREVFGKAPDVGVSISWRKLEEGRTSGGHVRRQFAILIEGPRGIHKTTLLAYIPNKGRRVGAFLGLNFEGNHACTNELAVLRAGLDAPDATGDIHYDGLREDIEVPPPRGSKAHRWPVDMILDRGYGLLTLPYLQVGPDHTGLFARGVHRIFSGEGIDTRDHSAWGGISMWSWMLSRILDGIGDGLVPEVDPARVILVGHSRLGKAALWAGASDDRFAGVISNNSGAMGAALSREVGETPQLLGDVRPHWFCRKFNETVRSSQKLMVDQHQLIACVAPRPVYIASASEDHPADPEGEFLSWKAASVVWGLYGFELSSKGFPTPGQAVTDADGRLGYHIRRGAHEVAVYDWRQWLTFIDGCVGS